MTGNAANVTTTTFASRSARYVQLHRDGAGADRHVRRAPASTSSRSTPRPHATGAARGAARRVRRDRLYRPRAALRGRRLRRAPRQPRPGRAPTRCARSTIAGGLHRHAVPRHRTGRLHDAAGAGRHTHAAGRLRPRGQLAAGRAVAVTGLPALQLGTCRACAHCPCRSPSRRSPSSPPPPPPATRSSRRSTAPRSRPASSPPPG